MHASATDWDADLLSPRRCETISWLLGLDAEIAEVKYTRVHFLQAPGPGAAVGVHLDEFSSLVLCLGRSGR
jgi:hypothetical protein